PEVREQLANSYLNLSQMLSLVGSHAEAIAAGQRGGEVRRKLLRDDPENIDRALVLSDAVRKLGGTMLTGGKPDDAFKSFQDACDVLALLVARNPNHGALLSK